MWKLSAFFVCDEKKIPTIKNTFLYLLDSVFRFSRFAFSTDELSQTTEWEERRKWFSQREKSLRKIYIHFLSDDTRLRALNLTSLYGCMALTGKILSKISRVKRVVGRLVTIRFQYYWTNRFSCSVIFISLPFIPFLLCFTRWNIYDVHSWSLTGSSRKEIETSTFILYSVFSGFARLSTKSRSY